MNDNLKIVERLFEMAKNELHYSEFPKAYNKEHIFLANYLNCAATDLEREFNDTFKYAVGNYKNSLKEGKKYGWFHSPEKLIYINMQLNQIRYAVYGERHVRELVFKKELGNAAYKDLINQIDCTVLMTDIQKKKHMDKCNKMAKKIMAEILKEENGKID
jgi:hypothetical protein